MRLAEQEAGGKREFEKEVLKKKKLGGNGSWEKTDVRSTIWTEGDH